MDQLQTLRRIGACENHLAQPDWKGPAIIPCLEPASFLCATCGWLLCGSHAGGHTHPAKETQSALASQFQNEVQALSNEVTGLENDLLRTQQQLETVQAENALLGKIRTLVDAAPNR